ncbi:MAG: HNH endonuclease signature motif containing protein [Actinomycetota bacterium]
MVTLAGVHEALKDVDPRPLSRRELCGLISDLEKLRSRLDERLMAAKAALDSLGDTGADSAVVGRSVGRRSERQATKDRVTARGLAEMPTLADGLAEGRLNVEHAAIVAAAAEETSPEVASELVPLAESIPADLFAKKAREFVGRHTSAQQAEARHRRQRERRSGWHHINGDGSVEIHARFDRATGESVLAAWRRCVDQLWRNDGGRDGTPSEIRSHTQRQADALAALITEDHPDSGSEGPRHQIHLIWNLDEPHPTWLDGTPVPDSVLERLGPSADVIGHVFSGEGQPLWQGRSKRLATEAQWRSLIVTTRGCAECGAGIDRCHAHHVQEWLVDDGRTDIDNLQLLCHTCHGHAHRGSRGDPRHHRRAKAA